MWIKHVLSFKRLETRCYQSTKQSHNCSTPAPRCSATYQWIKPTRSNEDEEAIACKKQHCIGLKSSQDVCSYF